MTDTTSYESIKQQVDTVILGHPIVTSNSYTDWFEQGDLTLEDVRVFTVQFSVFSRNFPISQLKKVINSSNIESMRNAKEILMNELGVMFKNSSQHGSSSLSDAEKEREGDPDLVGTEGSIEDSKFRFKAAHYEWLLRFGKPIGLEFKDIGYRKLGFDSTVLLCDELDRLYGQGDNLIGAAASYAVENWAAAGFWKQLIKGLSIFKQRQDINLPLAFFTWHDKVEENHAQHTHDELKEIVDQGDFDLPTFLKYGEEMLGGVKAFWDGLDQDRKKRHAL